MTSASPMLTNRSMPPGVFIPELAYPDVTAASEWLCRVFGFRERLRIGSHRVQLVYEGASMVVMQCDNASAPAGHTHSIMVRVADIEEHHAHVRASGVLVDHPPVDFSYGERQYTVSDIGGHRWTFSQSIADIAPADWGGTLVDAH
ncbi:VOC family protein [Dyella sp. 20L07]|uniref:VOC family protein n=1 Tax=Dyella sp. 20L07 TaxID=3384240 RepID=UPI003D2DDEE9